MKRLLAALSLLLLLAPASGCRSYPRTAVISGVLVATVGTLYAVTSNSDGEELGDQYFHKGGIMVAVMGAGLTLAGLIGWAQNAHALRGEQPTTAPPAETAAPASNDRLITHVRLAARDQRCEAALYLLHQLELRAPAEAQALRATDEHVQRCQAAAAPAG